jgi:tetratricopeptide (TPR) repeat protein
MEKNISRLLEQARLHIQHGHIDGAMDVLRDILSRDPDLADAHAYLAICLLRKRRGHAAAQEARIALTLEPESELAIYALALSQFAQRSFREAESLILRLLDLDPNDPRYYLLLADLYAATAQKKKVLPLLQKALTLAAENPDTLSKLSDYYLEVNNLGQAEHHAREALQMDPEHADALVSMGQVLLQKGDVMAAREHAIWALRREPGNSSALYLLTAIKTRSNPFLGLWWRYNTWINRIGMTRAILVLLAAFIIYRVAFMVFTDMDRKDIATIVNFCWLAIVIYSFIGPTLFEKALRKELTSVKLTKSF